MPERLLVSVQALFYLRDLPRFAFTGHWPLTTVLEPLPACFGFVFDAQALERTIQPQAAMNFALIPDWLRFAHFAAPGTPLASVRYAPVRRLHCHPTALAPRHLQIH
jgi:hypothetical protein